MKYNISELITYPNCVKFIIITLPIEIKDDVANLMHQATKLKERAVQAQLQAAAKSDEPSYLFSRLQRLKLKKNPKSTKKHLSKHKKHFRYALKPHGQSKRTTLDML